MNYEINCLFTWLSLILNVSYESFLSLLLNKSKYHWNALCLTKQQVGLRSVFFCNQTNLMLK